MKQFIKKPSVNGQVMAVAMISLTAIIVHGIIIPRLGFYYDDWYMLWSGVSRGPDYFVSLFSVDRPFIGVIYSLLFPILGENSFGWHVLTLVFRIATALAFYWILTIIGLKQKSISVLSAMLFVVFPGFLAEPNAATKLNHLISYTAVLFSIAFTLKATTASHQKQRYAYIVLSVILMAVYLWLYEYMVGLEILRICLMVWMWKKTSSRDQILLLARKILKAYLPYLLTAFVFIFWRIFIFKSTRPATNLRLLAMDYLNEPVNMGLRLVFQVIKDFLSTTIFAWAVQPYQLFTRSGPGEIVIAFLVAGVVVALALGYLYATRKPENVELEDIAAPGLILIGTLTALAAVLPVVVTNKRLDLMDPYKGYALHPSASVILIVIGIILMVKPRFRTTLLIAMLTLSVTTQSLNGQTWARFWELQRNFWWQLSWRAPDIADWTLVMAYLPDGFLLQQDYEIWGPVNLIYRNKPAEFPIIEAEVLNQGTVLDIFSKKHIEPHTRDIYVPKVFENLLLISQPTPQSCLHAIDGKMPAYSASERLIVEKVGTYSNIDFILPDAASTFPPSTIFGQEPPHKWCYYYQQAALARQAGNWAKIGELYDDTVIQGYQPGDDSEYFVFIEGLVNSGREADARKIANDAIVNNEGVRYSLCQSLEAATDEPVLPGYHLEEIKDVICPQGE